MTRPREGALRDLDAWMARLADGDRTAFEPLYAALWPIVVAFCGRRLADPGRAEDAAQQALVRVFDKASGYDAARAALPWVLTFAAWECRTVAGRETRAREDELVDEVAAGDDPERVAMRQDLAHAVRTVMGALSAEDEAALASWMAEDPAGPTLRKRIERARKRFAALWRRDHGRT